MTTTRELWRELEDPEFLRGVVYRHDADIRRNKEDLLQYLTGMRDELLDEIRELRRSLESKGHINPWDENTQARNLRRAELDSLRADAKRAEKLRRKWAVLSPAIAALLFALAELVRSLVAMKH